MTSPVKADLNLQSTQRYGHYPKTKDTWAMILAALEVKVCLAGYIRVPDVIKAYSSMKGYWALFCKREQKLYIGV